MRFARFGIAQWTAPLLIWLTSGCALAAPPNNDVLATNDQAHGGGSGGSLSISFTETPLSTLAFSVDQFGKVDPHTGNATISGTYTCTSSEFFAVIVSPLSQDRGSFPASVNAFFSTSNTCDGAPHSWSIIDADPTNGLFRGGPATATLFPFVDGIDAGPIVQTVQLRSGPQ
jgi:hypothetical protein